MTAHIQVVGRNHWQCLERCLRSCLSQTRAVPVVYVDNASTDGSAAFVRATFPAVSVYENHENRGYSGGHNDALRLATSSDVVIVLNPDVVLPPGFVERGLAAFDRPSTGAVVPLLVRPTGESASPAHETIDAYGTVLVRGLRAVDQCSGIRRADVADSLGRRNPWGFTGAAVFLRRRALTDVALGEERFDEDLFAYREDVDLSWRLRLRGWKIIGVPSITATHVRAVRPGEAKDRRIAQLSWRNYYLVIVKDVPFDILLRRLPGILLEDLARELQALVHPRLWPAVPELFRLLPTFLRKRRAVQRRATAGQRVLGSTSAPVETFSDGRINYTNADEAPVLSCVVRRQTGEILLLKRSGLVGAYQGRWHVVGGYLDDPGRSAADKALVELEEEVGIPRSSVDRVTAGEPFEEFDPDVAKTWRIHPVLVDVRGDPLIRLDWEHTEYRWVRPEDVASYHTISTVPEVLRRLSIEARPR